MSQAELPCRPAIWLAGCRRLYSAVLRKLCLVWTTADGPTNSHFAKIWGSRDLTLFPRGCRFPSLPGGGYLIPPLGNQGRSCFRPHVAKSYFETYKSYDHMQNFRSLSQKFSEISRFEKFEFLRFRLTLTHRNCHNSLNF